MGNYCILNGINSNELTGLLVSSLPPISKPLMRTQIETIDGRDGDIVTNLGYSAYDKKMEIGLYGDYDIDEIIAFFASEGTVTFSNEADKYYLYTIVDQIDFDRLVRYRTATVTFHVQPYKYDATETEIDYTNTYTEDNTLYYDGTPEITVTNAGNAISKPILTIYGSGDITVSLNSNQIFSIALGDYEYITIDTNAMEAYMGGVLLNRLVTGDYADFSLAVGANTLSFAGDVSEVLIENYSRWI